MGRRILRPSFCTSTGTNIGASMSTVLTNAVINIVIRISTNVEARRVHTYVAGSSLKRTWCERWSGNFSHVTTSAGMGRYEVSTYTVSITYDAQRRKSCRVELEHSQLIMQVHTCAGHQLGPARCSAGGKKGREGASLVRDGPSLPPR